MTEQKSEAVPVVGIGSSAGGLEALREMFSVAEVPTGLAFVVVQHLDPHHDSMLAELIGRHTQLTVRQCEGGERIEADTVFIIPPGYGLLIDQGRLELKSFAQPRGLRRPIDDFFISLANDQQANAACVILSGTGADGTIGLRAIKENGGLCVVQDATTAKYDGMPLSAIGTGLVDFIQPPSQMLTSIATFFFRQSKGGDQVQNVLVADHVDELCRTLRNAVGHDFSGYKRTTFLRRVERRMHVLGIENGSDYLAYIKSEPAECHQLFRDLLINVTRFFRDRPSFDVLSDQVVHPLIKAVGQDDEIRVWVPGCSSGEEAYSIAMLFAEAMRIDDVPANVQIFATDIDESMLQIAREGFYPTASLADIPLDLQERYLVSHKERFGFTAQLRDMIRFSNHSLIKDPPFSKIDLVSCRNLLIYFDEKLQQTVMPLLHYAIRPGGFLFLGSSESVGRYDNVFSVIDQKARLFERLPGSPVYPIPLPGDRRERSIRRPFAETEAESRRNNEDLIISRLMQRYVPPSVVLDNEGQIIAAHGKLSRFFEFPVSRSNETSAASLARPGVRERLGPLSRQARHAKRRIIARDVEVITEFGALNSEIICDPLDDGTFLFVFQQTGSLAPLDDGELIELEPSNGHVEALENELRAAKYRLRAATEELETANEELKSSNEEMMSMNEELQSTNEELTTVNDELKNKIEQLTVANADLRNFFESTHLAVIVLDRNIRIRSFTKAATEVFPLQPGDRGRPLSDVASQLLTLEYIERIPNVMDEGVEYRDTLMSRDRTKTFTLRILPYRTSDGSIDGATIVLTDISHAMKIESQLASERERLDLAISAAGIGVWEFLLDQKQFIFSHNAQQLLDVDRERLSLDDYLSGLNEVDRQRFLEALGRIESGSSRFELTLRPNMRDGSTRWVKSFARDVAEGSPRRIIGASVDVTAENELAEARELMLNEMNHRVKNLFAMIGGILRMAARQHETAKALAQDIEGRILALGNAHSLASNQKRTKAVELSELLDVILAPYRRQADISISSDTFPIAAARITPLTLILHEWTTNAVKHGVLGQQGGTLRVSWERLDQANKLLWNETGTQNVSYPGKPGFGTILLKTAAKQLGAEIETSASGPTLQHCLTMPPSVRYDA
ncbi:CheR family methyltransferase [Oryzifoliimicrobium ureilyticus]|uniref:CheR family methyltransferase n=1 Tax=Oryzifoliimicrobium ureilyticus TaxID=3113724 RepID=UPI0030768128